MSQLSLFGTSSTESSADRIQDTPTKAQKCPSEAFRFRKVHEPYGKPDKRGKYAYERFHEKATKIDERARVEFLDMMMTIPAERLEKIIEIGEAWSKCTPLESDDIRRSVGI